MSHRHSIVQLAALLIALPPAGACKKKAAPPPPAAVAPPAAAAPPRLAGDVTDSVFHDAQYGLTMRLPPGWSAEIGEVDSALRLRATGDRAPVATLEIWREPAGPLSPRPIDGCSWTFIDQGPFLGLPGTEDLTLATCSPGETAGPRVYAWTALRGEDLWRFELTAPWQRLLDAHREGAAVLSTVRWGERPN